MVLPAQASYLTHIKATHYQILNKKTDIEKVVNTPILENLFDSDKRVINLDTTPDSQQEAKDYFKIYYAKYLISISSTGNYVQVKNNFIYSYMYDINNDIKTVQNIKGNSFLDFFWCKLPFQKD